MPRLNLKAQSAATPFKPYSETEPAPPGWYLRNPPTEEAVGYMPHQAEFGEVIDELRTLLGREIKYKSDEWWIGYNAFIAGKLAAIREVR